MLLLMENGPFREISSSYLNNEVYYKVFVPRIRLKRPCKDYGDMSPENLKNDSSNIPIVKSNQPLKNNQPFAVPFVKVC